MKELITAILQYEIYIWIISFCIIAGGLLYALGNSIIRAITGRSMRQKEEANTKKQKIEANIEIVQEMVVQEIVISEEIQNIEDNQADIAQKMLQQIDIEISPETIIVNNLEERERSENINDIESKENVKQVPIPQTQEGESISNKQNMSDINSAPEIKRDHSATVEIYNTQTNLETVNKQKSRFELLKHEIENLKTRGLRVEYEKKLVEATIDFPEEEYFNTLLGDRYMENKDFKKAQTIYKKIHFNDPSDDKPLFKLGVISLELGDVQAAEYLVTKAKDIKPENPKYYQTLAEIKYNLEKIDECIECMEKAVDLRPTKFEYIEILGKLYKETNNIQLYYKTLLKMNALEPLNQRVKNELQKIQ